MEPFATAAELAAFLGRPTFAGVELAQARLHLENYSSAVRDYCGQSISLVEDEELELAGVWESVLELPERPIVAVSSVTTDTLELVADVDFVVVRDGLRRGPLASIDSTGRGSCGVNGWGGPTARVTVVYSHGFGVDAPRFKTAKGVTLAGTARGLANPGGVIQEAIGSYSVTYGSGSASDLTAGERGRLRRAGLARRPTTTITRGILAS